MSSPGARRRSDLYTQTASVGDDAHIVPLIIGAQTPQINIHILKKGG
ncbi:MAG: hypothetical protein GX176_08190 [Syntrophomonadaceae bacterium]|nr:hypothetical protein [Syntrophomonadaceae bacterium]